MIIFAMVISYIFNRNEISYEQQTTLSCFEIEHEENLKMAYLISLVFSMSHSH